MAYDQDIRNLIPQREPMIMVDRLLVADEKTGRSQFLVRPDNIFVQRGFLSASGLIENMAQTAAARIGYIGAIQNLEILELPKINGLIETEISIKNQIFDITIVTATVYTNGKPIALGDLKIFINRQT